MANEQAWSKTWWAEKLLIPLLVGLAIFLVQFAFPYIFAKKTELSLQIQEPVTYIDSAITKTLTVKVNDQTISDLLTYQVRIWNSGALPLKEIPVRLVFRNPPQGFQILRVTHKTSPEREFGSILEESPSPAERRFVYKLLNPGDEDLVTFWVDKTAQIVPYAKSEGMVLRIVDVPKPTTSLRPTSLAEGFFYGVLGAVFIEVVSIYNLLRQRRAEDLTPAWIRSSFYWLVSLLMVLCGGALVAAYAKSGVPLTPLLSLTLGAAAPLLLQHLVMQIPTISRGAVD